MYKKYRKSDLLFKNRRLCYCQNFFNNINNNIKNKLNQIAIQDLQNIISNLAINSDDPNGVEYAETILNARFNILKESLKSNGFGTYLCNVSEIPNYGDCTRHNFERIRAHVNPVAIKELIPLLSFKLENFPNNTRGGNRRRKRSRKSRKNVRKGNRKSRKHPSNK